jgi:hypothetical protein
MVLGFTIPVGPTRIPPPHPNGFEPHHWLQHRQFSFLFIPVAEDESIDESQFFYCERCSDRGKWFRASGSVGNVHKYVINKDKEEWDKSRPIQSARDHLPVLREADALLSILEERLPFTFIEAPRLRSIMQIDTDHRRLRGFLYQTKDNVANALKSELSSFPHLTLVVDEWTDASLRHYVGLKVHCANNQKYSTFCLEHSPLTERADAKNLAQTVNQILEKYDIKERVRFIVTDTARVMPAMVHEMGKVWSPCWGHIYNLMLSKIVESVRPECLDELFQFTAAASHSIHWRKLVNNATKYNVSALPTYSVTRWYSLWKLLKNVQIMKDEINLWLTEERRQPISELTWGRLAELFTVVSTFKNATEEIERDSFGTCSYVYDGLTLVRLVCERSEWLLLSVGWHRAYTEYRVRYLGDGTEPVLITSNHLQFGPVLRDRLLLATLLNPAVNVKKSLSDWELGKAFELLERAWTQASPSFSQPRAPSPPSHLVRGIHEGLTRRDLLMGDEGPEASELDRFHALDRRPMMAQAYFDLFQWWTANKLSFPVLYQIALGCLVVPATSAAVERQFSKGKLIHTDHRQSLRAETLSNAVFLRSNLQLTEHILKPHSPSSERVFPESGDQEDL